MIRIAPGLIEQRIKRLERIIGLTEEERFLERNRLQKYYDKNPDKLQTLGLDDTGLPEEEVNNFLAQFFDNYKNSKFRTNRERAVKLAVSKGVTLKTFVEVSQLLKPWAESKTHAT